MAYDKAVDSGVLDAGLKLIADAIREKGGTEDTLAFPQAMADAIAAIEAGGGGVRFATGTFTIGDSNVGNVEVTHNIGLVPNFVFFMKNDLSSNKTYGMSFSVMAQDATPMTGYEYNGNNRPSFRYHVSITNNAESASENFSKKHFTNSGLNGYYGVKSLNKTTAILGYDEEYPFMAGMTYNWICAVIATTNAKV